MDEEKSDEMLKIKYEHGEFEIKSWPAKNTCGRESKPYGDKVAESVNAVVYHYFEDDRDYGIFEDETYALCKRGHVSEAKKLLLRYLMERGNDEIKWRKEDIENRERDIERMRNAFASVENDEGIENGMMCSVEFVEHGGWKIEKTMKPRDRYDTARTSIVMELTTRKIHSVCKAFKVDEDSNLVGQYHGECWEEDLDVCKRIILDRRIKWLEKRNEELKEYYERDVNENNRLMNCCKEIMDQIEIKGNDDAKG